MPYLSGDSETGGSRLPDGLQGEAVYTFVKRVEASNEQQKKTNYRSFFWWEGMDSNHRSLRRRIYSPLHLTALPPLQ